jgi:glyoxylate reductase
MRPRVFVTQPVAPSALERLRAVAEVKLNPDPLHIVTAEELRAAVHDADILFCLLHDQVDRTVIAANPSLRAIAAMAIVPAGIDLAEATARRIPVTVIPPLVTEATADVAWALLLAVARRVVESDRLLRAGTFPGSQSSFLEGAAVWDKTLGLVGAGRIGRAVARRGQGFGMRLLYAAPRRLPAADEAQYGLTHVPLPQLFAESDFISLHAPLTPETRHMIGARELSWMKPTAFLINTARGPILDEQALAAALAARQLAGAALDVFEDEPRVTPALLPLTNVVLTPHIGSAVRELREAMAHVVVDNILALLEGRRPPNCFNPEVLGG